VDVDEMKYEILTKLRDEINQVLETSNPSNQQKIDNPEVFICTDCKKMIPQNVADYSQKWYGKHLCRDCQVEHKEKEESP